MNHNQKLYPRFPYFIDTMLWVKQYVDFFNLINGRMEGGRGTALRLHLGKTFPYVGLLL